MENTFQVSIVIPGNPKGKERARSRIVKTKSGGAFVQHYTPTGTRNNEKNMGYYAIGAMNGRKPTSQPVYLQFTAVFEVPNSWPQWKKDLALSGSILPTTKPDLDNIEKSVKDAFNKIIWLDDCQVVKTDKEKVYGKNPGIYITITERKGYPAQIKKRSALTNNCLDDRASGVDLEDLYGPLPASLRIQAD